MAFTPPTNDELAAIAERYRTVAGLPMMNGSATVEGFLPLRDATVVTRVLDAGGDDHRQGGVRGPLPRRSRRPTPDGRRIWPGPWR